MIVEYGAVLIMFDPIRHGFMCVSDVSVRVVLRVHILHRQHITSQSTTAVKQHQVLPAASDSILFYPSTFCNLPHGQSAPHQNYISGWILDLARKTDSDISGQGQGGEGREG